MGELDGRMKYRVHEGMTPGEIEQVLWREKTREDRIRATDRRMARWVWADAARPMQLVGKLAAQGVVRQAKNTWFDTP